jgi:SIR2-like domain
MITTNPPTVLVLGAGASQPYGYPLGSGLRNILCSEDSDFISLVEKAGHARGQVMHFMTEFGNSNLASVDVFLERRPTLAELGRTMIAAALLRCENGRLQGDWYSYLWQLLAQEAPTIDSFRRNNLRVITFNYDTSIERFLINSMRASYDVQLDEAKKVIDGTVQVIHVHGQIPYKLSGSVVSPNLATPENVRDFAGKIITLHQGEDNSREFSMARYWLGQTKRVLFLGFSYQADNVRRLAARDWLRNGVVMRGSTFGMVGQEINRLASMFQPDSADMEFQTLPCIDMLRHNVMLLD